MNDGGEYIKYKLIALSCRARVLEACLIKLHPEMAKEIETMYRDELMGAFKAMGDAQGMMAMTYLMKEGGI